MLYIVQSISVETFANSSSNSSKNVKYEDAMRNQRKKRSKKSGLPPGSLVYIGDKVAEASKVTLFEYDGDHFAEKDVHGQEELRTITDRKNNFWLNIRGIHDPPVLEKIGDVLGVHPLILEDILNTDHRPKLEDMDGYIFLTLKHFCDTCDEDGEITAEQVSLILGPNYVLSFQERDDSLFEPIRERLRTDKGKIRKAGADYLAYSLIDMILDSYFGILETLGERIEAEEDVLVNNPDQSTLHLIQNLKRDMIFVRKSIWPLREAISALERSGSPLIAETTRVYLKDVYDHTIQIIDTVETYRDMLSGMVDIYLSSLSNRMNQVMKVLTIIATIFIPMTFIAGIYGMNFKDIPELQWGHGYLFFWLVNIIIVAVMLVLFKRKKWF